MRALKELIKSNVKLSHSAAATARVAHVWSRFVAGCKLYINWDLKLKPPHELIYKSNAFDDLPSRRYSWILLCSTYVIARSFSAHVSPIFDIAAHNTKWPRARRATLITAILHWHTNYLGRPTQKYIARTDCISDRRNLDRAPPGCDHLRRVSWSRRACLRLSQALGDNIRPVRWRVEPT